MPSKALSDDDIQRMSKNDVHTKLNQAKPKIFKSKKKRVSNYVKVNGGFTLIPHKLITSPEYNDLSYADRSIYQILLTNWSRDADKAYKEFICPYVEIQRRMTDSKGKYPNNCTITDTIKTLERLEYIFVKHGGKNNPTKYRINVDKLI